MTTSPTIRLYWQDDHLFEVDSRVVGFRENAVAFDRSCFYPGSGGQPSEDGTATLDSGRVVVVSSVQAGTDGVVWHNTESEPPSDSLGRPARLTINREKRLALSRYHL